MNTYQADIVTDSLIIKANSEEEAELKYEAFFAETACPCGVANCDCVKQHEDCSHTMELIKEAE